MLLCADSVVVHLEICPLMVNNIHIDCYKWTKLTADNRAKAGKVCGISAVIKALNVHICNTNVCQCGCAALWNMTTLSSKTWLLNVQQQ